MTICDSVNLTSLKTQMSAPLNNTFQYLFTAKTYKQAISLRSFIFEGEGCQKDTALYQQKNCSSSDLSPFPH